MKDAFGKAWNFALDAVDWLAEKVERHPRKVLLIMVALAVL